MHIVWKIHLEWIQFWATLSLEAKIAQKDIRIILLNTTHLVLECSQLKMKKNLKKYIYIKKPLCFLNKATV